eukprot:4313750-Alexandrium_andersonii.AAC.1
MTLGAGPCARGDTESGVRFVLACVHAALTVCCALLVVAPVRQASWRCGHIEHSVVETLLPGTA